MSNQEVIYHWFAQTHIWPWLVMFTAVLLGIISAWITWNFLQRRQLQANNKHQVPDKIAWLPPFS